MPPPRSHPPGSHFKTRIQNPIPLQKRKEKKWKKSHLAWRPPEDLRNPRERHRDHPPVASSRQAPRAGAEEGRRAGRSSPPLNRYYRLVTGRELPVVSNGAPRFGAGGGRAWEDARGSPGRALGPPGGGES